MRGYRKPGRTDWKNGSSRSEAFHIDIYNQIGKRIQSGVRYTSHLAYEEKAVGLCVFGNPDRTAAVAPAISSRSRMTSSADAGK